MSRRLRGKPVIAGRAEGTALVSEQPLSFWGGLNPQTGEITDRRHDRAGAVVTGRVFVFPTGKGSSTASAILLESIKAGTAPAAIINHTTDPMLALAAIIADELYQKSLPIVVLPEDELRTLREGDQIAIEPDGTVLVR